MPEDTQPEFEWPAILRLPQVPPLKVPARRQTQFMARPAPVRYTEQVPVTPPPAPEKDLFMPLPVTPPLTHQHHIRMRAPDPLNRSAIRVSTLPDEKSCDGRDAIDRVRSGSCDGRDAIDRVRSKSCDGRDAIDRVRSTSAPIWNGRDQSRPYNHTQGWISGISGMPVRRYIPTTRRSRDVGNGEFLLGCAFLIFMSVLVLGLLTWLSAAR